MSKTTTYIVAGVVLLGTVFTGLVLARYRQDIRAAGQRVDALGSQVRGTECGPIEHLDIGDGYPVLVIHGIFGGLDQGIANIEGVLSDDYRRIIVSRFGYLGSPLPEEATPELQARYYACLLDELGVEQVVVVAYSAGSTSAMQFALNYPERVKALVLVSATAPGEVDVAGPPLPVARAMFNSDFAFWMLVTYFRPAMYGIMGVPEGYEMTAEDETYVASIMATVLPVSRRGEGAVFDMYVSNPDVQNYPLEDIAVPTLIVNAVDDPLSLYQNADRMAQRIPGAELFAVEQGGHMMLASDGEAETAILEFINRQVSAAPTQTSIPTASPTPEPTTFESPEDFQTALAQAIEKNTIDTFWNQVVTNRPVPLIFGNTAVFIYRGEAKTVRWSVDYALSDRSLKAMRGQRQGNSDIWLHIREFPADARLSYRLVIDDNEPILDPLNPYQAMEGSGPVSELRMPAYVFPEAAIRPDDIPRGSLSDNITFHSEHLPYAVTYRVYTPFGYESLCDLPVIYVADGQEYLDDDLGSMVIILDKLIADGAIQPIIAVFLDPRDAITGSNRRASQYTGSHTFDAFLIEELVPTIDSTYRTGASAHTRAILGGSFGGMLAAHVGLKYPDTFGLIGMHSPVFPEYDLIRAYAENDRLPLKVFMSVGTLGDAGLDLRRYVRDLFLDKGYPLRYIEVNDGHAWGNYRRTTDDTLIYFFGQEK